MADLGEARRAKDELKAVLAGRQDVTAVGIAPEEDGYGLLVRLRGDVVSAQADGVPREVRGVHVRVSPGGTVHAQS
ncbi:MULTISPECIES: hypothetical protein [Cellulomonas]|uniref:hypothetical protein n=1 Tax=Cellulomonas TaxID=1707 RepID=UPI0010A7E65B|nr:MULTISPECIES: hypothetical protein [Cellulomonas]